MNQRIPQNRCMIIYCLLTKICNANQTQSKYIVTHSLFSLWLSSQEVVIEFTYSLFDIWQHEIALNQLCHSHPANHWLTCDEILFLLTAWGPEMSPDCTSSQNNDCYDWLSIYSWGNFTENVWCHTLPIDNSGSSLIVNMQYYSQTIFIMNQSWDLQLL